MATGDSNMTTIIMIIVVVVIVFLLFIFIQHHIFKQKSLTSGVLDATQPVTISSDNISSSSNGSMNYTWSVWIYVADWSTFIGQQKTIFVRGPPPPGISGGNPTQTVYPKLSLGRTENNLTIQQSMQQSSTEIINNNCMIENIPLQKWTNIIVSLNDRDMDVYLNGKLVRTCVLAYPPYCPGGDDVIVSPGGQGFQGSISNLKYWANAISPQQAWNIYQYGPGGSSMTDIFNKFQLKFVFLENGKEEGSFTI